MSSYFEKALPHVKAAKDLANFLIVEINSYLNKKGISIDKLSLKPETLGEIISMQEEGLTHKQASDILFKVLDTNCSPKEAKEALHIVVQVSDASSIMSFINQALANNPQSIVDYKAGKDRALGFLVGQVMKLSHGKVNPAEVSKLLLIELKKR